MGLNKKRLLKLIIFLILNTVVILMVTVDKWQGKFPYCTSSQIELKGKIVDRGSPIKRKTILIWNGSKRSELAIFGTGNDAFVQHGCLVSDCEIVNSIHQYPERTFDTFDAILVNFNKEFWLTKRPNLLERNPQQRFIFFTQEPPPLIQHMNITGYDGYFNWTMTYRMDSDIPLLYGRIKPKQSAPKAYEEIKMRIDETRLRSHISVRPKNSGTSFVAAMISVCETDGRREEYIKELSKHIKIDVYGWCSSNYSQISLHCDPDELLSSSPECYDLLASKYKFYLSFENSICPDYVTEKFFQIASRHIVPVVYGGANYSRIAPAHSYINALNYKPKELAAYLKLLANNESQYNEYFWWKEFYVVEAGLGQMVRNSFCDLCQKLHEDGQLKTYRSLTSEWGAALCQRPKKRGKKKRIRNTVL